MSNQFQQIDTHPEFPALVALEKSMSALARRPGNRAALSAMAGRCMRMEQQIMRDTGASFLLVSGRVLAVAFGRPSQAEGRS